jgi:hypothetical protein
LSRYLSFGSSFMFILLGRTEETHDRRQSEYPASASVFEPGTSQIKRQDCYPFPHNFLFVCVCVRYLKMLSIAKNTELGTHD